MELFVPEYIIAPYCEKVNVNTGVLGIFSALLRIAGLRLLRSGLRLLRLTWGHYAPKPLNSVSNRYQKGHFGALFSCLLVPLDAWNIERFAWNILNKACIGRAQNLLLGTCMEQPLAPVLISTRSSRVVLRCLDLSRQCGSDPADYPFSSVASLFQATVPPRD